MAIYPWGPLLILLFAIRSRTLACRGLVENSLFVYMYSELTECDSRSRSPFILATQSLVIEGVYLLFKGSRRSGRRRRSGKPSDPDQKHNTLLVVMGGASDVGLRAFVCSRAFSVVLPASVWSVWKKRLLVDSIHLNSLTNTRRRTSRIEGDRLKNHIE